MPSRGIRPATGQGLLSAAGPRTSREESRRRRRRAYLSARGWAKKFTRDLPRCLLPNARIRISRGLARWCRAQPNPLGARSLSLRAYINFPPFTLELLSRWGVTSLRKIERLGRGRRGEFAPPERGEHDLRTALTRVLPTRVYAESS